MTPAEVAKYVKAFQKAARTRKVKSRLIRRDVNYHDNIAELIRPVLPRSLYRMVRRRRGYELVWQGSLEMSRRLLRRLPLGAINLCTVTAGPGTHQAFRRLWLNPPYDALLDEAVMALPILVRFRQDEAQGITTTPQPTGEPLADTGEAPTPDENFPEDGQAADEFPEEEPVTVTPAVPPAELAEEIAAAVRARAERVPTNVDFRSEGARRFSEELARATRGH